MEPVDLILNVKIRIVRVNHLNLRQAARVHDIDAFCVNGMYEQTKDTTTGAR